jgi:hypothetical protein
VRATAPGAPDATPPGVSGAAALGVPKSAAPVALAPTDGARCTAFESGA